MAMINKINTGSNPINKLYTGSTEVQKAYLGDTLIYGNQGAGLLKFTADEANSTIRLNKVGTPTEASFETSTDKTVTWSDYTLGSTITLANVGDSVYIRNKSETVVGLSASSSNYYNFTMTGKIKASGDINYMLCKNSTDTLVNYCYYAMFQNCTSLVQAPELPATTLATHCYSGMFESTSLVQAPELPATTLVTYCYDYMFYLCTSLVQAPTLPATTLTDYCYRNMFYGCTSLVQAPALPATDLAECCYYQMFRNCTSLVQAPELPATNLASQCYYDMFRNCTNLVQLPELPATNLANYCYIYMFYGCTKIKLSETQNADYTQPYRIPTSGTGTVGTNSLNTMFDSTGGTFTGTPTINTTYYLHKDNTIVG